MHHVADDDERVHPHGVGVRSVLIAMVRHPVIHGAPRHRAVGRAVRVEPGVDADLVDVLATRWQADRVVPDGVAGHLLYVLAAATYRSVHRLFEPTLYAGCSGSGRVL